MFIFWGLDRKKSLHVIFSTADYDKDTLYFTISFVTKSKQELTIEARVFLVASDEFVICNGIIYHNGIHINTIYMYTEPQKSSNWFCYIQKHIVYISRYRTIEAMSL